MRFEINNTFPFPRTIGTTKALKHKVKLIKKADNNPGTQSGTVIVKWDFKREEPNT